jgi:hypothetical protein
MLGRVTVIQDDKRAVFVELEEPAHFKINEEVVINKAKKVRTLPQNSLYWVYLTWIVDPNGGDLRSRGYFSVDALHLNIKGWIKETHPQQFKVDKKFTTTTLTRQEFSQFFDLVNQELFIEFFEIDTSPFWVDYERFGRWQQSNPGDMSDFLKERLPF